jgi:hypothetical protein
MPGKVIDVPAILDNINTSPAGSILISSLKSAGMPDSITDQMLGVDTLGEYDPAKKQVAFSWQLNDNLHNDSNYSSKQTATVGHEFTHAALDKIMTTVYRNKDFPQDIRDQIDKFSNSSSFAPISRAIKAAGKDEYRASYVEYYGFGVGNTIARSLNKDPVNPVDHIDASAATDFAILSDLYNRGVKQMNQKVKKD